MKVRQQARNHSEFETRVDEEIGGACTFGQASVAGARGRFERSRRGRADGDDATALVERQVDTCGRGPGNLVAFRLDGVVFDTFGAHRLKCAVPDVQRQRGYLNAASLDRVEQSG